MINEIDNIEAPLLQELEGMVGNLAGGAAGVWTKNGVDGIEIRIVPANKRSAEVVAWAKNGLPPVTLWLGRSTPAELYPSRRESILARVVELVQAVINGRFKEDLWLVDDTVVRCQSQIELRGRWRTRRYFSGTSAILASKTRIAISYEPYASNKQSEAEQKMP
jgi:hypothetical protein